MIIFGSGKIAYSVTHKEDKTILYEYTIRNDLGVIELIPKNNSIEVPGKHKVSDLINEEEIKDEYNEENLFYKIYN